MVRLPKVLIFTPLYAAKDYSLKEFVRGAKAIDYPEDRKRHIFIDNTKGMEYYTKLKRMGLDVFHVERGHNSREALARAQNFARNMAIKENYDYMFSLESDIYVEPDILKRLMSHAKPVVTALYFISPNKTVPCITIPYFNKDINAYGTRLLKPEEFKNYYKKGLKQVQAGGFGTCLIRKDIFRRFKFTYDIRFNGHSDIYFFNNCFNNRIPVYTDTDIVCEHDNSDWSKVEDR